MTGVDDPFKAVRDVMLLSHKLDSTNAIAKEANDRSLENRERIGRIETAMTFMMRDIDSQRRLPPPY